MEQIPAIKHYAYLGYWVYCVLGEVYICNTDGNIIDAYYADETTMNNFIDAKARINDHREGLVLLHGIIPNPDQPKDEEKPVINYPAWQRVKDGKHKLLQGAIINE